MSVTNPWGMKVILPRLGPDAFWSRILSAYDGADQQRWKQLAMLSLKENSGWTLDMIASAFGHERGHVSRQITALCRELREAFQAALEEEAALEDPLDEP